MSSALERVYDQHSFNEMNECDYHMLTRAYHLYNRVCGLQHTSVFFDVGCNSGSFVRVLKDNNVLQNIHCFEPHPVMAKRTAAYYPHIKMNEECLSDTNGFVDVYLPALSCGLGSIINRPVFSTLNQEITVLNVPCETIDMYCSKNNISAIDFIKIDIEGAEMLVLKGASQMLKEHRIKFGIFELGCLKDAGSSVEEVISLIEGYGYTIDRSIGDADYAFYIKK
jgi:FkbM family methyltransferase